MKSLSLSLSLGKFRINFVSFKFYHSHTQIGSMVVGLNHALLWSSPSLVIDPSSNPTPTDLILPPPSFTSSLQSILLDWKSNSILLFLRLIFHSQLKTMPRGAPCGMWVEDYWRGSYKAHRFWGGGGEVVGYKRERERERERVSVCVCVKAILVVACGGYPWQFGTI